MSYNDLQGSEHEQLHQSQVQLEVVRIQAALPVPPTKKTRRRPRHSPR